MLFNTEEKKQARLVTVIEPTRRAHHGNLPNDMHYVTLSGHCSLYGEIVPGSDYDHMISSGLVRPEQFIGVDAEPTTQRHNAQLQQSTWITCPIEHAIKPLVQAYKIGLVFLDTTSLPLPKSGLKLFEAVLEAVCDVDYTTVIVVNWCLKHRQHDLKPPQVITSINNSPVWQKLRVRNPNWTVGQEHYLYKSDECQSTRMGSWIFTNAPGQLSLF